MMLRLCAIVLALAGCAAAQSMRPEDLAQGKMLVAPRGSPDPLFAGTVILLVKHGDAGTVGLVLNRRSTIPVSTALKGVRGASAHAESVYVGGPVQLETVMAVQKSSAKPEGSSEVFGSIYLIAARTALEKALAAPANPAGFRTYLGYCGWAPHQLEAEMRRRGWWVFDRSESAAFDGEPSTLWSRLIAKTEAKVVRLGFLLQPA